MTTLQHDMQHKQITLSCGLLSLNYHSDQFKLDELLDFAERINPKRAFLFVSKVLGRHIPVQPNQMRRAFTALANLLPDNLPEPILVIGMAETAVGLSAGVHQVLCQKYPNALLLNSTRHACQNQLLTTFKEEHSHASTHLIYLSDDDSINQQIFNSKTVIMVDDEASTGKTCKNLMLALRQSGLNQIQEIHLATLVDWSIDHHHTLFDGVNFYRHHLLQGNWTWTQTQKPNIKMPDVATTKPANQPTYPLPSWGRTPTFDSSKGLLKLINALDYPIKEYIGKKILVLGSNEFVWLAFLLAEYLENQGANIHFGALTRSPIMKGGCIHHVLSFCDNYGLGMINFVYNVDFDEWDLVLLCIETPKNTVDPIWHHPHVFIISPFCES